MSGTKFDLYNNGPLKLKQEANARALRLLEAQTAARKQQLAANVLKGAEAAEITPGYTASPTTGLLVSDRTIDGMNGKDSQSAKKVEMINHERLNQAISGAVDGHSQLHGVNKTPNYTEINKALDPAAKMHLDKLLETFGDDGRMVLSRQMAPEEMKKLGVTYVGNYAREVLQENREKHENRGSSWRLSVINTKVELNTPHTLPEDSEFNHPSIDALVELALESKRAAERGDESQRKQLLGDDNYKWFWAKETNESGDKPGSHALYVNVFSDGDVKVDGHDVRSANGVGGVLVSGAENLDLGPSKNL